MNTRSFGILATTCLTLQRNIPEDLTLHMSGEFVSKLLDDIKYFMRLVITRSAIFLEKLSFVELVKKYLAIGYVAVHC